MDLETFRGAYPEFVDVPDGAIMAQLDYSGLLLNKSSLHKYYDLSVGLFTAHRLALRFSIARGSGLAGRNSPYNSGLASNISASNSSLSQSSVFGAFATGNSAFMVDLAKTGYGTELLALWEMIFSPVKTVF